MRLYSTALLMASAAATMTACISTPTGPSSSSGLSSGGEANQGGFVTPANIPPPTKKGEDFFNTQVLPTMKTGGTVACTTCHTSGFLQAPKFLVGATARDVYLNVRNYRDGALIQPPSANLFLNKGPHEGPDLNLNQFGVIKKWAEIENPVDDTKSPQNFFDALHLYEGCLDFDQFQTQQLDQLANQVVNGNDTCGDCHVDILVKGPGLFLDPNNARATFDAFTKFPNVLKLVSAVVTPTGSFVKLVPSNRLIDKGVEFPGCSSDDVKAVNFNVDDPNYCHPEYVLPDKFRRQIETFVSSSISDSKEINCKDRL